VAGTRSECLLPTVRVLLATFVFKKKSLKRFWLIGTSVKAGVAVSPSNKLDLLSKKKKTKKNKLDRVPK
jgi:hypothetical protein